MRKLFKIFFLVVLGVTIGVIGFEAIMFTPDPAAATGCAPANLSCTLPIAGVYRAGSNFREDGQAAGY